MSAFQRTAGPTADSQGLSVPFISLDAPRKGPLTWLPSPRGALLQTGPGNKSPVLWPQLLAGTFSSHECAQLKRYDIFTPPPPAPTTRSGP